MRIIEKKIDLRISQVYLANTPEKEMIQTVETASEIMWRKLNNRLRKLKKRYGNRKKRDIWSWLENCDYTCYWYNEEWMPDYMYHKIVQDRVNTCLDKIMARGIFIEHIQYFFRDPLENKSIDFLNWNFKIKKSDIVYTTEINHEIHCDDDDYSDEEGYAIPDWYDDPDYYADYRVARRIRKKVRAQIEQMARDERESHYKRSLNIEIPDYFTACSQQEEPELESLENENEYNVECYGKVWGCPEMTNGTQFCCKHYCPFEFCDDPSALDDSQIEDWSEGWCDYFK